MAAHTPIVVGLYDIGSGRPERVAEFRLAGTRAELTILGPGGCRLAQEWFDHGVEIEQARRVLPDDGPGFLRALLQPIPLSYYQLVDESPVPPATPWSVTAPGAAAGR
ncbi:hypothetical protein [Nocardia sp. alder85J]|uniref:hypothetical protein n=1 Tax=Nocardia sp. alder85J TaxID=2862949 RepID=UPI001CD710C6|nr:hypothetical protein [Nocardia sp. alder85J]MCX4093415.1 hypothetical protein [Nocardia sp. alder85J]